MVDVDLAAVRAAAHAVGVPMATPSEAGAGNANAPLLVAVPCGLSLAERVAAVSVQVAAARASAPPAAPITLLGRVMSLLVRSGPSRRYLRGSAGCTPSSAWCGVRGEPVALAGIRVPEWCHSPSATRARSRPR